MIPTNLKQNHPCSAQKAFTWKLCGGGKLRMGGFRTSDWMRIPSDLGTVSMILVPFPATWRMDSIYQIPARAR